MVCAGCKNLDTKKKKNGKNGGCVYYCKKQKLECIWIEDEAGINCKLEVRRKQNTVRKKMTVEQRQEMKYCDLFKLIKKAESKIEKMEEEEKEDEDAEYM